MMLRKSTLLTATLLASLALTACHNKEHSNPDVSLRPHVKISKQDKATPLQNFQSKEIDATRFSTQETVASLTEHHVPSQVTTDQIDLQALSKGDYSSIAGTWTDADGNSFVIDAQGNITSIYEGSSHGGYSIQINQISEHSFTGGLIAPNGQAQGSFMVVPAGVATPNAGKIYEQDVICSGQSALAEQNPYFRK